MLCFEVATSTSMPASSISLSRCLVSKGMGFLIAASATAMSKPPATVSNLIGPGSVVRPSGGLEPDYSPLAGAWATALRPRGRGATALRPHGRGALLCAAPSVHHQPAAVVHDQPDQRQRNRDVEVEPSRLLPIRAPCFAAPAPVAAAPRNSSTRRSASPARARPTAGRTETAAARTARPAARSARSGDW